MSSVLEETPARILTVGLTTGTISSQDLDEETIRTYLGGSYLGTKLWLDTARLEVDALSAANTLVIAPGLLTGYPVFTANRTSFVSKSPLTGLLSESTVGGYFGPKLRAAGYDALVLKGSSRVPCYVFIDGDAGTAEIVAAGSLWGQDVFTTDHLLKDLYGEDIQVAAIGPAGENGVYYASVITGGVDSRAAGRTGMGAVMGSKNLKAIVVKGGRNPRPQNPKELALQMRDLLARIKETSQAFMQYGTAGGIISSEATGNLPIENWKGGNFPGAAKITGQAMWEMGMVTGHYTCFSCPIHCGKHVKLGQVGDRPGEHSHGPEYETIAAFGSLCLNEDPEYIAAANDLANRLGVDTISSGNAIAFAMEAYERGIIDEKMAGRPIKWGDGEVILYLLREIAYQRGFGAVLAKGVRQAAEILGPLAKEFAVHVKGLELPFHDPRTYATMAVNYATAQRGACHLESMSYYVENGAYSKTNIGVTAELVQTGTEGKAEVTAKMQDIMTMFNALGLCKFLMRPSVTVEEISLWIKTARGIDLSSDEIKRWGEREFNLRRLCNVSVGITRKDDTLPPRLLSHPRPSGHMAGNLPFMGRMMDEYYRLRGWDPEGIPTLSTLRRLDLVDFLDKVGIREQALSE